jgi:hypothetical protein
MSGNRSNEFRVLKRLAAALGWSPLRRYRHRIQPPEATPTLLIWYESGLREGCRLDCFLQINECPIGQQRRFSAAVYAPRFRLASGWHTFRLPTDGVPSDRRLARLDAWLAHRHFASPTGRKVYRALHPETIGYSWPQLRRVGPPYQVVDAAAGLTRRVGMTE